MNYIRHLSAFYMKAAVDDRLSAFHISLYHALFQLWNMNRFEKPVYVNRQVIRRYSKIGSNHTLYRCLNELHTWGYIEYLPSFSPKKGTYVNLCIFDIAEQSSYAENAPDLCKNDIGTCAETAQLPMSNMHTNINYIYTNNIYTNISEREKTQAQNLDEKNSKFLNQENNTNELLPEETKRKKVAPKKEKVFVKPLLKEVLDFFQSENYPEKEGRKFYYHFEANGWKVGGKSPMKNWEAAAHNWMLNTNRFEVPNKNHSTKLKTDKNYGEPL